MTALFSCFAAGGSLWEKIAEWYQNSLLRELIIYISEEYFTLDLGSYDNFAISGASGAALRNMILAVAAGIILATLVTLYNRRGLGGFVRHLIASGANSPENAKTLMELGYFRSTMIRRELAKGTALRMVVRSPEQEAFEGVDAPVADAETLEEADATDATDSAEPADKVETAESADAPDIAGVTAEPKKGSLRIYKPNFVSARFYIPEDLRARAEVRFDLKGSGWISALITIGVTVFAASAACWFLPDLIQFADNIISFFS